jgi:glycosyltransferase involved in cell wall biosynthesis
VNRVAVLVNNYNNGPWLRECIESVLKQTRAADEVIVYDDGSSDGSPGILRSFGNRIRLIEGNHDHDALPIINQALAIARALAVSSAEHVYLLDGDDVFLPHKIESYEKAWALRPTAVMVQAPMVRVDATGAVLKLEYEARNHVGDQLAAFYRRQDCDFHYPTSALAFRREFMERVLAEEGALTPDINATDTNLATVAPLFGPVLTLDPPLTWWRRTMKSLKAADPSSRLTKMRERHRWFNHWAALTGGRPLRLWLCREYYKERLVESGLVKRGGWFSRKHA